MLLIELRVLASATSMFPIIMCETHPYGKRFGWRDLLNFGSFGLKDVFRGGGFGWPPSGHAPRIYSMHMRVSMVPSRKVEIIWRSFFILNIFSFKIKSLSTFSDSRFSPWICGEGLILCTINSTLKLTRRI